MFRCYSVVPLDSRGFRHGTGRPGRVFVRFTSTRPDESRLVVRVNIVPNDQEPFDWKGKTLYLAAGREHARSDIPRDQWLRSGESSPWIDLGRYMTSRGV